MERDGKIQSRRIILGRSSKGSYIWTCTNCRWEYPLSGPGSAPAPLEAIDEFSRHACDGTDETRGEECFGESGCGQSVNLPKLPHVKQSSPT